MIFKKLSGVKVDLVIQEDNKMTQSYNLTTTIPKHVFRAYDIRGIVGDELTEDGFYTIGRTIASTLRDKGESKAVLGFDGRQSSHHLAKALMAGFLDSGVDVISVGLVPSPVLYFALHHLNIPSGVMVTGSHNPKDYNGIKMVIDGCSLEQGAIDQLRQRVLEQQFTDGVGQLETVDVVDSYIEAMAKAVHLKRPLKVAIDCGNGVAGRFATRLFKRLGVDVVPLFCEVDGDFPNHHPDPSKIENLQHLISAVKESKCDLGLAFDGDADRLGLVTEKGEVIMPDRQLMALAEDVLFRHKAATIVYDVKCTHLLKSVIEANGGFAHMCPTGHSIIKRVMREKGALLAGEMSGHVFIKDKWFGFDDGLYAGARLIEIISKEPLTTSQQFSRYPDSFNTAELLIPIAEEEKFHFVERLKELMRQSEGKPVYIDGLRLELPFGWGLVRASNTSPNLVARFEADSEAHLDEIKRLFREKLLMLDEQLAIPF